MGKNKYALSGAEYIESYEKILLLRRFEEKCGQLYGLGLIRGFCHLYIGQEAVAVGTYKAKKPGDSVVTSYRCHAHAILSGIDPKYVLAELTGKTTGSSKGKGGSMHIFNPEGRFYGGHGIVGAQVPIGTGISFASKYRGEKDICFTFLGDGAINQGQVYEAFNMAALWSIPVVYIIENNEYSMGTSVKRSTYMTDLYKKGESFGIEGFRADGMDLEEIYSAVSKAADYARSESRPVILEVKTYRYRGHSMSDPAKYREKGEVEEYKKLDPLHTVREKILAKKFASEGELKTIEDRVKASIKEIVDFAENSPAPGEEELYTDICP